MPPSRCRHRPAGGVTNSLHKVYSSAGQDRVKIGDMYARQLHKAPHTRRFSIVETGRFWEVREEEDSRVVRTVVYDDWHRVERARMAFAREANALCERGWTET